MQHLLSRARVYVATSQYEPFGLSLVEAALSRCAILASDIASFRELWGDNVLYFESNNPASLEAGLVRLYEDRELAASYGKLAYDHALRNYRSEQMVDAYVAAYVSLMNQEALAA